MSDWDWGSDDSGDDGSYDTWSEYGTGGYENYDDTSWLDDSSWTENLDDSSWTQNFDDGSSLASDFNGDIVSIPADEPIIQNDGPIVSHNEDGSTSVTATDGTHTTVNADLSGSIIYPDGNILSTNPDTNTVMQANDGPQLPVGEAPTDQVTVYDDGSQLIETPEGATVGIAEDDEGHQQIIVTAQSTQEIPGEIKDMLGSNPISGTAEQTDEVGNSIKVNLPIAEGGADSLPPTTEESREYVDELGQVTNYYPDGTVTTVHTDGTIGTSNPDGSHTLENADGTVTYTPPQMGANDGPQISPELLNERQLEEVKENFRVAEERLNSAIASGEATADQIAELRAEKTAAQLALPKDQGGSEPEKAKTFGEAFAEARESGEKVFEFEGKKFTTETWEEKRAADAVKTKEILDNRGPSLREIENKITPQGIKLAGEIRENYAKQEAAKVAAAEASLSAQTQIQNSSLSMNGEFDVSGQGSAAMPESKVGEFIKDTATNLSGVVKDFVDHGPKNLSDVVRLGADIVERSSNVIQSIGNGASETAKSTVEFWSNTSSQQLNNLVGAAGDDIKKIMDTAPGVLAKVAENPLAVVSFVGQMIADPFVTLYQTTEAAGDKVLTGHEAQSNFLKAATAAVEFVPAGLVAKAADKLSDIGQAAKAMDNVADTVQEVKVADNLLNPQRFGGANPPKEPPVGAFSHSKHPEIGTDHINTSGEVGTVIDVFPDKPGLQNAGVKFVEYPGGKVEVIKPDGSITTKYPDKTDFDPTPVSRDNDPTATVVTMPTTKTDLDISGKPAALDLEVDGGNAWGVDFNPAKQGSGKVDWVIADQNISKGSASINGDVGAKPAKFNHSDADPTITLTQKPTADVDIDIFNFVDTPRTEALIAKENLDSMVKFIDSGESSNPVALAKASISDLARDFDRAAMRAEVSGDLATAKAIRDEAAADILNTANKYLSGTDLDNAVNLAERVKSPSTVDFTASRPTVDRFDIVDDFGNIQHREVSVNGNGRHLAENSFNDSASHISVSNNLENIRLVKSTTPDLDKAREIVETLSRKNPADYEDGLIQAYKNALEKSDVEVHYVSKEQMKSVMGSDTAMGGYKDGKVYVREDLTDYQKVQTAYHEYRHHASHLEGEIGNTREIGWKPVDSDTAKAVYGADGAKTPAINYLTNGYNADEIPRHIDSFKVNLAELKATLAGDQRLTSEARMNARVMMSEMNSWINRQEAFIDHQIKGLKAVEANAGNVESVHLISKPDMTVVKVDVSIDGVNGQMMFNMPKDILPSEVPNALKQMIQASRNDLDLQAKIITAQAEHLRDFKQAFEFRSGNLNTPDGPRAGRVLQAESMAIDVDKDLDFSRMEALDFVNDKGNVKSSAELNFRTGKPDDYNGLLDASDLRQVGGAGNKLHDLWLETKDALGLSMTPAQRAEYNLKHLADNIEAKGIPLDSEAFANPLMKGMSSVKDAEVDIKIAQRLIDNAHDSRDVASTLTHEVVHYSSAKATIAGNTHPLSLNNVAVNSNSHFKGLHGYEGEYSFEEAKAFFVGGKTNEAVAENALAIGDLKLARDHINDLKVNIERTIEFSSQNIDSIKQAREALIRNPEGNLLITKAPEGTEYGFHKRYNILTYDYDSNTNRMINVPLPDGLTTEEALDRIHKLLDSAEKMSESYLKKAQGQIDSLNSLVSQFNSTEAVMEGATKPIKLPELRHITKLLPTG